MRLAAKVEEEEEEAREGVREKRRAACVSLGVGSEAGAGERGKRRHSERDRRWWQEQRLGGASEGEDDYEEEEEGALKMEKEHRTPKGLRPGQYLTLL